MFRKETYPTLFLSSEGYWLGTVDPHYLQIKGLWGQGDWRSAHYMDIIYKTIVSLVGGCCKHVTAELNRVAWMHTFLCCTHRSRSLWYLQMFYVWTRRGYACESQSLGSETLSNLWRRLAQHGFGDKDRNPALLFVVRVRSKRDTVFRIQRYDPIIVYSSGIPTILTKLFTIRNRCVEEWATFILYILPTQFEESKVGGR